MRRWIVAVALCGGLLFAREEKPFLFVTLRSDGERVAVIAADTVMGTERPLRGERSSGYRFRIEGSSGALLGSGDVAPPPPLRAGIAAPDGSWETVALPAVEWSVRVPLPEGGTVLRFFEPTEDRLKNADALPAVPEELSGKKSVRSPDGREVAVWNFGNGGAQ